MEHLTEILISVVILVCSMAFGLPIPIAFFVTTMSLMASTGTITSYVIVAVPLFILAGGIMEIGGIGEKLLGIKSDGRLGRTKHGIGPIHFAAILATNLGLGCITPPVAPVLYLAAAVGNAEIKSMFRHTFKLILFGWLPTLAIIAYFPDVALCLARLIMGYKGG